MKRTRPYCNVGELRNALGEPARIPLLNADPWAVAALDDLEPTRGAERAAWIALINHAAAWRIWLEQNRVTQPFKQAHREIYIVTDAEIQTRTYSNRYAAHIIKQHQFSSLCKQRNWKYMLQGAWDREDPVAS